MAKGITQIKLLNFRGASTPFEIELNAGLPMVMLFGENGTGKTTIVDALDLIGNKTIGSFKNRSSTTVKQHVPTIGKRPADVTAQVSIDGHTWTGKLSGSTPAVSGPDGQSFPPVFVLRRSELLRLIEAQPAERYRELQRFINVEGVESAEGALKTALDNVNQALNNAVASKREADEALRDLWQAEGDQSKTYLEWGHEKAEADVDTLQSEHDSLETLVTKIESATETKTSFEANKNAYEEAMGQLDTVQQEVRKHPGVAAEDAIDLIDLLAKTKDYVAKPDQEDRCPVCLQDISTDDLRQSVDDRLSAMTEINELRERLLTAKRKKGQKETLFRQAENALVAAVNDALQQCLTTTLELTQSLRTAVQPYADSLASSEEGAEPPTAQALEAIGQMEAQLEAMKRRRAEVVTDLNQHTAIKQNYYRIVSSTDTATTLEKVVEKLRTSHGFMRIKRLAFTQAILDEVAEEANRLYGILHPGESIGIDELKMDENRRGSLNQTATFNGTDGVPPQAYFSDAHLDTLGFCIWLAVTKRDQPENSIIILDDIFTSVDASHLTRIVEILANEAPNFRQVIVTTHYRNWRERYRYGQGPGARVHLVELRRWSLEHGIRHSKTKPVASELETVLLASELDRQAISSKAGILLEGLLDSIAILYRCRVPRTIDNAYTLNELLNGTTKTIKKITVEHAAKTESDSGEEECEAVVATHDMEPLIAAIAEGNFIRNTVGCHYNSIGDEVSDADVEEFGKQTMAFAKAVICPNCGDMARRPKGTHFECGCGQLKMTSLQV